MTRKEILERLDKGLDLLQWDNDRMSGDGLEGFKQLNNLSIKLAKELGV